VLTPGVGSLGTAVKIWVGFLNPSFFRVVVPGGGKGLFLEQGVGGREQKNWGDCPETGNIEKGPAFKERVPGNGKALICNQRGITGETRDNVCKHDARRTNSFGMRR